MTAPDSGGGRPAVEFNLRARHLLVVALLAVAALIVARVWLAKGPGGGVADAPRAAGATGVENLGDSETLFDREGGASGVKPAPGRQVTPAGAARGGWEVDVGAVVDREQAERVAGIVRDLGFPAHTVWTQQAYHVVAGPFEQEADARRAAERLRDSLERTVYVYGPSPGQK